MVLVLRGLGSVERVGLGLSSGGVAQDEDHGQMGERGSGLMA